MKHLAALLLLTTAALPLGAKWKVKEKRYDPVRITDVRQIAGRYIGIDPDFVIDLRLSEEGTLSGTMRSFGRMATLRDIRIDGPELTAVSVSSGTPLPLHATFANRLKNGQGAFGLVVHDAEVQIEDVTLSQIFCRKAPSF
jgi:hypothetical protein